MANTKTISSAASANGYALVLELTETGTSAAANTSTVSWRLVLTSGAWHFAQYRVGWSVSLAGTVVSSRSKAAAPQVGINKHSALTVASGTATVAHNDDGTLRMACAASIDMDAADHTPGPLSLSGTMDLTDIPRASSLTAANGTLGTAQTLAIHRADSGYTHTVTYTCGSASGTIATKTTATSLSWTPPLTLAAQNTTGATVSVKLTLITYNGSAEVGRTHKTVSMAIPASVKPTASAAVELVNDNATVNGWGVAVKGYSKYRITTTFTGAQGSTLKARSVTVDATGETLTASPVTTRVMSTARTVRVRVQDSRGRWSDTATVTGPVIYDYGAPAISEATACRCGSAGSADDAGTYLYVKCAGTVYSCGGHNGKTVQCRRRAAGGSWSGWTSLTSGTAQTLNVGLDAAVSYEVQFRVSDSLGSSRAVTVTVPTAAVALHLRSGGRGAAFGKYAEKDDELQVGGAWRLHLANMPLFDTKSESVTVTAYTAAANNFSCVCRYYPYLGVCLIRGSYKTAAATTTNGWVSVANIPAGYRPGSYNAAMTVSAPGGASGLLCYADGDGHSAGDLCIRTFTDRASGTSVDLSGWWFV